jgi:RNA-binding protein
VPARRRAPPARRRRFRYSRAMPLTGKQRRHLRGLGHALEPVVHIGKGGIDDALVAAVDQALSDHELIKVKVGSSAAIERHDAATELAGRAGAEVAQVLGNMMLLYRPDPDHPVIVLPRGRASQGDGDHADDDLD